MKDEGDPVTPDELIIRLVWCQFFRSGDDPPVRPVAFHPRVNEADGISVFRLACVSRPEDILAVIAPEKQSKYAIVLVPVTELSALGLTVRPARIERVPGHAVIPELNHPNAKANQRRMSEIEIRLAELASRNIVRVPQE